MKKSPSIFLLCYLLCAPFVFAGNDVSFRKEEKRSSSLSQKESEMRIADSPAVMIDPVFTQVKKVQATNGADYDIFGFSVSISGDTVVVGAREGDGRFADTGAVYIFDRNYPTTNAWGQRPKIFADDGEAGDGFGCSVSISGDGDTVVVGAKEGYGEDSNSGSAYIFDRNYPTTNAWGQRKRIFHEDVDGEEEDDQFGISVSISKNTVVVGAYFDDDKGTSSGSAYIFDRDQGGANNWGQVQKIVAEDGAGFDNFGASVSISENTVLVGAFSDYHHSSPKAGSAYIFDRNPSTNVWGQVTKIIASDYATSDQFGFSVSISGDGDTAVVGAFYGNGNVANTGSVYIFDRNYPTTNAWGQSKKIIDDSENGEIGEMFGISVSISGDRLVVGADFDNDNGSAYIFDRNYPTTNAWGVRPNMPITAYDGAAFDRFGHSVSISGDTVVVGAYGDDDKGDESGSAYVYKEYVPNNEPTAMPGIPLLLLED